MNDAEKDRVNKHLKLFQIFNISTFISSSFIYEKKKRKRKNCLFISVKEINGKSNLNNLLAICLEVRALIQVDRFLFVY